MLNKLNRFIISFLLLFLLVGCNEQPTPKPIEVIKKKKINIMAVEHNKFDKFMAKEFNFSNTKKPTPKEYANKDIYYYMLQKQGIIQ